MYLNEADQYQRRPLHLQILQYLQENKVADAIVFHGVAGFIGLSRVKTSSLVDAGGKLPLLLTFVDEEDHIETLLPKLKDMVGPRRMVRENVTTIAGTPRG